MLWFLVFGFGVFWGFVLFCFYVILGHQSTIDILILLFFKNVPFINSYWLFIQNLVQTLCSHFKIFQHSFFATESVVNSSVKIKWTCLLIELRGSLTYAVSEIVTRKIQERKGLKLKIIFAKLKFHNCIP